MCPPSLGTFTYGGGAVKAIAGTRVLPCLPRDVTVTWEPSRRKTTVYMTLKWYKAGKESPDHYTARRPSKALPRVISSAYSRSPPTGNPLASRVTAMPMGLIMIAR